MTLHTAVHTVFPYQLDRGSGGCLYLGAAAKKMIVFIHIHIHTRQDTPIFVGGMAIAHPAPLPL